MKFKLIGMFLLVLLMLSGCKSISVQDDLINYYNNELSKSEKIEKEAVDAYFSVTGDNYQDDSILYDTMTQTVIPKYKEFKKQLEAIKPKTKVVKELHSIFVGGVSKQYSGFLMIVEALEKQDADLINQANDKLVEGKKAIDDFNLKIDELFAKYNVVIK